VIIRAGLECERGKSFSHEGQIEKFGTVVGACNRKYRKYPRPTRSSPIPLSLSNNALYRRNKWEKEKPEERSSLALKEFVEFVVF
jgi:hypothetical protein